MHRHHACIDVTAASKIYNKQNYATMKDSAKLHKTNIPAAYRTMFKVSNTTLGKCVDLV